MPGYPARIAAAIVAGVGCGPSDFVLYGGTGLALQLGHRVSEDFDFFSSSEFDPDRLRLRLPFFRDLDPADPDAWVHHKRDNLEAFVNRNGVVRVAFFGGLDTLQRVEDLRALQFYGDGTLNRVPAAMQQDLTRWAQGVDLAKLPTLHPRRGLSPGGLER